MKKLEHIETMERDCPHCIELIKAPLSRVIPRMKPNPTSKQPKDQSTSREDKLSEILWKHTEATSNRVQEAFKHKSEMIVLQIADEHKELSAFISDLLASSQRELLEKIEKTECPQCGMSWEVWERVTK